MIDALKEYTDARERLSEYFDAPIWHNLIINLEDEWTDYGSEHSEIGFDYQTPDEDSEWDSGEFMDSFEIYGTSRWLSKDKKYTLFVGNDGCGNRDCYILNNEKRLTGV